MLKPIKIQKDLNKVREAALMIYQGKPIGEALLHAGYPKGVANLGRAGIPQIMHRMIAEMALADGKEYVEIGRRLTPQMAEDAIAGRLFRNMVAGESKGNEAAGLLGKMRKYNAFEKDSFAGVIVLAAPGGVSAGKKLELPDEGDVIDSEDIS